jgi:hypothetical protein
MFDYGTDFPLRLSINNFHGLGRVIVRALFERFKETDVKNGMHPPIFWEVKFEGDGAILLHDCEWPYPLRT